MSIICQMDDTQSVNDIQTVKRAPCMIGDAVQSLGNTAITSWAISPPLCHM